MLCADADHFKTLMYQAQEERDAARAEVERLRAEIELHVEHEARVRDVVGEYVNDVESGEKFDALLALLEDTPAAVDR